MAPCTLRYIGFMLLLLFVQVDGNVYYNFNSTNFTFQSTIVPFHQHFLNQPISGPLLTQHQLESNNFNLSRLGPFILLCNISIQYFKISKTCSDESAQRASALIGFPPYIPSYPGRSYYLFVPPPMMAPMLELSDTDYSILFEHWLESNGTLNVTLYPTLHNEWITTLSNPGLIFAQCFISLESVVALCMASYCLHRYHTSRFPSLCHIVLILEIISNIIRLVYFAVDPFFTRRRFPYEVGAALETITLPFSFSISLLIGLFWYGLVQKKSMRKSILLKKHFRVPAYVSITLMFIIEIACELLRMIEGTDALHVQYFEKIEGIILAVVALLTFGFYIFTGYVLLHLLRNLNSRSDVMLRIQKLLTVSTFLVFVIILVIIGETTPFFGTLHGYLTVWFIGYFTFGLLSIVQVAVFWPKKPPPNKTPMSPHITT
eukprot:TRINITY_DN10033_c0_g1_i2.p1 TRINITY_DN10033_c0_g1~~TRINITY_DN10033_c0_g1_i2.p1  ORF type:complete len:443 (-),score=95.81 TRINITY_DN10033_c0_g1_i2:10-1305(-)